MFGYITPDINELKVKDYSLFRAYYCGLCRVLKNEYKAQTVLNYDAEFVYILNDAMNNAEQGASGEIKCGLHPVTGRPAVITECAEYAAAVNVMMGYYKLKDDFADLRKPKTIFALKRFKKKYNKAAEKYPEIASAAEEMWRNQQNAELSFTNSTDVAAEPYGKLFGAVLERINKLYECQLYDLGYALGRWVYLIDAYDDIAQDIKTGSYNVYVEKYRIKDSNAIPEDVKRNIENSLYYTLSRANDAYSSLDIIKNEPLLANIIKLGLKNRTANVLKNTSERKEDGSLPRFRR